MNTPRQIILRRPHMELLADFPAVDNLTDAELFSLEVFMHFCSEKGLSDPKMADVRAYAQLNDRRSGDLDLVESAFIRLGMPEEYPRAVQSSAIAVRHQEDFEGITRYCTRNVVRQFSLPVAGLPESWRKTLRRLQADKVFAESILDRMAQRLGMFAWSATRNGFETELGSVPALKAFYAELRQRSAARNSGLPRWAYLRSTWEELCRFARANAEPEHVIKKLASTYTELSELEQRQSADKWGKLHRAGTASGLLAEAEKMLENAHREKLPQMRHALRNRAAAIGLGVAIPARPADVHRQHHFGTGIFFATGNGCYRFSYTPRKTSCTISEPLDILLRPHWNRFIDALILQDQDERYLPDLRAEVIAQRRPLYINYDRSACTYSWYSRAWKTVTGTGGHIARSLIYDEMADLGEFGIQYARSVNHHVSEKIPRKYRSEQAIRKSFELGQDALLRRKGSDDDIADLV